MKKLLKWLGLFVPWALAIGIPLVWNELSGDALSEWTRTTLGLEPGRALLILALLGLAGAAVTALVASRREKKAAWETWRETFRQACRAKELSAGAIVGSTRPMTQPFVDGVRALARPVTLQTRQDEQGGLLSTDAARYLREQIVGRGRLGLLLQGRPLLGKTRFLVERLQREHPEMYVLAPDPARPVPVVQDSLADHIGAGCCLLLDDLEQFADRMPEVGGS